MIPIRLIPVVAAAVALTAGSGLATAQTTTTVVTPTPAPAASGYRELDDLKAIVQPYGLTAEELDGKNVVDAGGDKIGEIEGVLADDAGSVAAFILETGGFLGLGDRDVIVPIGQLQYNGERFTTTLDRESLRGLPTWDD